MLYSGLRKKLRYYTPREKFSTPGATPAKTVKQQKQEQAAAREKSKVDESVEAYSQCCQAAQAKVQRVRVAIESAQLDHSKFNIHALNTYLKTVDTAYAEANEYLNKIYLAAPSRRGEFEPLFVDFEELYEFVRIALCQMIEEHTEAKAALQLAAAQNVKPLPVPLVQPGTSGIDSMTRFTPTIVLQQSALPTFDGKYESWFKFKQMFRDIADKCAADSAATKLHFLDKALVGKAQGAIDPQIIRDNDYEGAWRSLTEQFENLPALISETISRLLSLKAMTGDSFHQLKTLIDEVEKCVSSLEFHKLKMDKLSEAIVITLVSSKLDADTRKVWESSVKRGQMPAYKQLISVLRNQQHVLERCENAKGIQKTRGSHPAARSAPTTAASKVHTAVIQKAASSCPVCDEKHAVEKCDAFKRSEVKIRYEKAKQLGLCFACLKRGHRTSDCPEKVKCSKCAKRHHVLLHPEEKCAPEKSVPEVKPAGSTESAPTTVAKCVIPCRATEPPTQVLLATAVVYVYDDNGDQHKCRVLLDSGAMANFVSQRMADLLQLKKRCVNIPVIGVSGMRTMVKFQVHVRAKSRASASEFCLDYLVVPRVTGALPVQKVHIDGWPIPAGVDLADPTFFEPSRIDLLVGAEAFFEMLLSGKIKMSSDLPVLQESTLGWLVSGRVAGSAAVTTVRACQAISAPEVDAELTNLLKKFWTIDDQTVEPKPDDDDCERHFAETHVRAADGRYVVRLPFRKEIEELGASRQQAEKRFNHLERRLDQNPAQKKQYAEFIKEYVDLGHGRVLAETECGTQDGYFLPHHCVLRPDSSTTKLRVVFDASARSTTGHSLNDTMMIGPPVQDTLFEILLRFRLHKYAFTADVPKMYRQVRVSPEDTKFQRIVWRDDRSKPLQVIELMTVTYGTAAAPFLATRALNQLAADEKEDYPEASKVVSSSFYVDDVLSGAATIEKAKQLQSDLVALLARGGFELHKWCANDASLLEDIPIAKQEKQLDFENHDAKDTVKTLGLLWNPVEDHFFFRVKPLDKDRDNWTKQQVLSEIAKLFDPLGLLGPTVALAKMVMQETWRSGIGWNDVLPPPLMARWRKLRNALAELAEIKIPRRVTTDDARSWELHGYADASAKAYGCSIYLRNVKVDGTEELFLLCGKSRVTPVKEAERRQKDDADPADMTMPRLEACAAELLAEQIVKVVKAIDIPIDRVVLWSDSQIVLSWLEYMKPGTPVFVRNRVNRIRELTSKYEWHYVSTKNNPADHISRGLLPKQLKRCSLWWKARHTENLGPIVMLCEKMVPDGNRVMEVISECGSFRKLERIFGYVLRFVGNCKKKPEDRRCGRLGREDYSAALQAMVKAVQQEEFSEDLKRLEAGKPLNNKLNKLNPMVEKDSGLLRVGGRLSNSDLPYNQRHPMILPEKHHFTELIIETLHNENLHVGLNGLLASLRRRFWPVNAKRAIHRVLRRCVTCFRVKPTDTEQLMGDLPKCRVTVAEPFARTGVDYAGPVMLKQGRLKAPIKGYIAVFVCLCTKAIHLELVTSMSTEAFLAALHRFVSRRGNVSEMKSDNGTNFIGAARELTELAELLRSQMLERKLDEFCQARSIDWSFNPPKAPHQGGLWEAGVKSAKHHLYRVLNESHLTYEEMNTLLIQIEAVLNSRPLCQQTDDPLDYRALSPGHFLVGRELTALPEPLYDGLKENKLTRYQLVQKRKQDFYRRWCNEYLTELQQRGKWNKGASVVRKGMLVILKQDNVPPQQWRLGRIVDTHPGKDGVTRVVTVRTSSGEYRRPTTQVAVLPILDNETQELEETTA